MNFSTSIDVITPSLLIIPTTGQPIQTPSVGQTNQVSYVNEGILLFLFFLGYVCIIFGYKKYQREQITNREKQIKTLEKTWKMVDCSRKLDSREHD